MLTTGDPLCGCESDAALPLEDFKLDTCQDVNYDLGFSYFARLPVHNHNGSRVCVLENQGQAGADEDGITVVDYPMDNCDTKQGKPNYSCCPPRPRTTPFPEEKSY